MDNGPQVTPPSTPDQSKVMSAISYIGPLVIVSYLMAKDNPAVKFHIRQGGVLFVIEVAIWVLSTMLWFLWPLWQLVNLATLILAIIGIINVTQGKEKELPIVGKFGSHIPV